MITFFKYFSPRFFEGFFSISYLKKNNLGIEGMCSNFLTRTTTLNAIEGGRLVGIGCIYLDSIRMFELFRTFKSPIKYC